MLIDNSPAPVGEDLEKFERIAELDILKVFAILAIVVCHLHGVVSSIGRVNLFNVLSTYISIIGLSIFFFTSGYSLMLKSPTFDHIGDVIEFFKKRFIRIYPLFWFALVISTVVISSGTYVPFLFSMTKLTLLQQLLALSGVSGVLYPAFMPSIELFWFVSAIMMFYLFFPILIHSAEVMSMGFTKSVILTASVIFSAMIALRLTFGVLGLDEFFIYYWFFIAGIVLGRRTSLSSIKGIQVLKVCLASGACIMISSATQNGSFGSIGYMFPPLMALIMKYALFGAISTSISILLVNNIKKHMTGKLRITRKISQSTYSIYLFHIYFLTMFSMLGTIVIPGHVALLVIVLGIPCAVIAPMFIQLLYNRLIRIQSHYKMQRKSGHGI